MTDSQHSSNNSRFLFEDSPRDCLDILKKAPIGIFTSSPQGRFLSVNPALSHLLGYESPEKLIDSVNHICSQIYADPEEREALERILDDHGQAANYECRWMRRDGSVVWVSNSIHAVRDESGSITHYQGFVLDITCRKQKERALYESEKRYRNLVESQNDLIVRVDPEYRFTYVNDTYCRFFGKGREELIGATFAPLVYQEDVEETLEAMKKLWEPPYRVNILQRAKTVYGLRWVLWEDSVVFGDNGEIAEIQAVGRDVTQIKQAHQELEQKQEQLEQTLQELKEQKHMLEGFFEATPDAASIQLPDHTVVRHNLNGLEMFNMAPEEVCGIKCYHMLGRRKECSDCATREARDSKSLKVKEKYIPELDSYIEQRSTPILDENGEVKYVAELLRDITERKKDEQRQRFQLDFQQAVARASTRFVRVGAEGFDAAVNETLKDLGRLFQMDRSYVFCFSRDLSLMSKTHEWCAEGVTFQKDRIQEQPVAALPRWKNEIMKLEPVHIPDVNALPVDAEAEKKEFQSQDIQSLICLPMVNSRNELIGFLGFDAVSRPYYWPEDQISMLQIIAETMASAFERNQIAKALQTAVADKNILLDNIHTQIWYLTDTHTYGAVNQAHADFFGVNPQDIAFKDMYRFMLEKEVEVCRAGNQKVFESGKPIHTEEWLQNASGDMRLLSIYKSPKLNDQGRVEYVVCSAEDITERKHYEERLKYLSLHDQLTGLYNRAYLENELKRLSRSREHPVTIMSIDVDGLKAINDMFGHEQGDRILKLTADILQETFRASDILGRAGGDEFVALLPGTDAHAGRKIAQRIRSRVEKYNREKQDTQLPLSLSAGMAVAEDRSRDLFAVFKEADDLMYRDKLNKDVTARSQIMRTIMAALEERDFITHGHARRLEDLCRLLGERAGLSEKQLSNLALLAQVHDLGKVGIPDHVLFKEAPLTDEEWEIMYQHPEKGYRIARASTDLADVADLILKHHERWDGEGYPLGLDGEEIPVECRILAIADAYDAMTSDRPYRKALAHEDAIAELKRCSGTQFDPDLVDKFIEILQQFHWE